MEMTTKLRFIAIAQLRYTWKLPIGKEEDSTLGAFHRSRYLENPRSKMWQESAGGQI